MEKRGSSPDMSPILIYSMSRASSIAVERKEWWRVVNENKIIRLYRNW